MDKLIVVDPPVEKNFIKFYYPYMKSERLGAPGIGFKTKWGSTYPSKTEFSRSRICV